MVPFKMKENRKLRGCIIRAQNKEIIRLLFCAELTEDALTQLNRNFSEIEYYLSSLQRYMNETGYSAIEGNDEFQVKAITHGIDANKPTLGAGHGLYFSIWGRKCLRSISNMDRMTLMSE